LKEKIVLIGGGGHCNSVIDVIEAEDRFEIVGILDDNINLQGKEILGYPILGTLESLDEVFQRCQNAMITIGFITPKSLEIRKRIFNRIKEIGYQLPVIKSPLAYISKSAEIGEGTVIMHQVLINSNVRVGKNCIINSKALIEHDSIVGDNSHISTGAILNGGTTVKDDTFFGSGAVTKQLATISGFVKAGSVVK